MASNGLQRVALGDVASLGTLYDARTDSFLPTSLLKELPPESAITRSDRSLPVVRIIEDHDDKSKFSALGIEPELGASLLAGLVNPKGSGGFLKESRQSNFAVQMSFQQLITTVHEKINFTCPEIRDFLAPERIQSSQATHVVTEITWGGRSILSASYLRSAAEDENWIKKQLQQELAKVERAVAYHELLPPTLEPIPIREMGPSLQVRIYTDVSGTALQMDLKGACDLLRTLPDHFKTTNGGRGYPVMYTLLPVQWLSLILTLETGTGNMVVQPSKESVDEFLEAFVNIRRAQRRLKDYWSYLSLHRTLVPEDHVRTVVEHYERARKAEEMLQTQYGNILLDVRLGRLGSKQLQIFLEQFNMGNDSPQQLTAVADLYARKLAFIDQATSKRAEYITDERSLTIPRGDVYTLYFNRAAMDDNSTWNDNFYLLMQLLDEQTRKKAIRIVDCDRGERSLQVSSIMHHRDGKLVTEDLRKLRDFLSDKCLMQYDERHLDTWGTKKPIDRKPVKLACPGPTCDTERQCQWICSRCYSPVDCGHQDNFLYCDCGRTRFHHWSFRCDGQGHGTAFERYEAKRLLSLLNSLEPFEEINILILGETGVGKSTFINAFVNYLSHSSLEEAINADSMEHLIPCAFATQTIDRNDPLKRLVQTQIKIGNSQEEHDGSRGQSATQKTLTYPIFVGSTMVRLIDTPGIGDTRGLEQDRKNMADVLSVLRNYQELHGILVLLKPNNSRLNVMFKFCIKELLTHLHRNAAHNMVFGFTNTRGSNYNPGDTFKPLEALLSEYRDVNLGLFHNTVYCFDSESFRYLAAHKQGVNLGSFDDYFRSWEQSAIESRRLLNYIRGLEPHQVQNTLSLNETRHLVLQLTKPMAEIAQKINDTIELNERDTELLRNSKISKDEMLKRLNVQQNSVVFTPVSRPKTVCTNARCIEKVDIPGPNGEDTVHKSLCHDPCCLTNVPVEKVGTPELIECSAFGRSVYCQKCSHGWKEHKHILYEHKETSKTIKDPRVEMLLQDNAKVAHVIEAAIKAKKTTIAEFRHEHRDIQKAAVRFSLWLKHHSITPYNDATLEYLDHLIREETSKVQVGGKRQRLDAFEQYRREYMELVKVFETNLDQGNDEELLDATGVDGIVKQLYSLKHYGADLRKLRDVVAIAHAATYRERPYRVNASRAYGNPSSVLGPGSFQATIRSRRPPSFMNGYNLMSRQRSGRVQPIDENGAAERGEKGKEMVEDHPQNGMSTLAPPSYFEAAVAPRNVHERQPGTRSMVRSFGGKLSDKMSSIFR